MWGFLLETVWCVCCFFNNSEILAWVRRSGQRSPALASLQHLLGRGAASQLSARFVLFCCPSHPLLLFLRAVSPVVGAYRIEEMLLRTEFKGFWSGPVLALPGFWRRFGVSLLDLLLFGFGRKDTEMLFIHVVFSIQHLLSLLSQHFYFFLIMFVNLS